MLDLLPVAPGPVPGASACCRHCGRQLRDPISVSAGAGPKCSPRHGGHSRARLDVTCGGTQLDLLTMPPEPEDWPVVADARGLACGRCGVVLVPAGWTLREALAAVEGHAAVCSS